MMKATMVANFMFALLIGAAVTAPALAQSPPAGYDEALAAEVGADEYGMRRYVMAFLKRGPNRPQDAEAAAQLQRAHMDNIQRMAEAGVLIMAGPFMGDSEMRGIYLFAVDTLEEARALTETDPAVQAGSLVLELQPWYGPAALMRIGEISARITRMQH